MVRRVLLLFFIIFGIFNFVLANEIFAQDIKVAISNNNFSSSQYKDITLSATSDWQIFDEYDKKVIVKLKANQEAKIVLNAGMYDIYINDNVISDMISGPLTISTSPQGLLKIINLQRRGKDALYRGTFTIDRVKSKIDVFYLINKLDIQKYLYSVVPNEMPVSFGLEALKAQAIAARNYVLRPRSNSLNNQYDVTDSVNSQVYFGANTEHSTSNKAVDETNNIVAINNGQIILALYHSTSGGMTENYEHAFNRPGTRIFPANPLPYLKSVSDIPNFKTLEQEEDARIFYTSNPITFENASPFFRWQREWTKEELSQILNQTIKTQMNTGFVAKMMPYPDEIGELKDIKVTQRGKSGKIVKMSIIGDKNVFMVEKELVIRNLFKKDNVMLPSANVVFEQIYDDFGNLASIKAYGGGYGHGVGMSQFGAGYLAKNGKSFENILHHYYKNISLATVPVKMESDKIKTQTQQFYTNNTNGYLRVENLKPIDKVKIKINSSSDIILRTGATPQKILTYKIGPYLKEGLNNITYQIYEPANFKNTIKLYVEFVDNGVEQ